MTDTASTELSAETQPLRGAPAPSITGWPPPDGRIRPPPPPELRQFVRAMSELGVPVAEIARRVGERIGTLKSYGMRQLYRDFSVDLIPRMKRGKRGEQRYRLIDKPTGWKPIRPGSPFSYGDLLAILQSDLDSRDLGRLYGVKDELLYSIRRGTSKYTKYLLPRMTIAEDNTPDGISYRAMVTAELAVRLVKQLSNMIENHYEGHRKRHIIDRLKYTLYRRNSQTRNVESREIATDIELKAARLDGWTEEPPEENDEDDPA